MAIEITGAWSQTASLPSLFLALPTARTRLRDFLALISAIPTPAVPYLEVVHQCSGFCAEHGIVDRAQVESVHVAAFVEASSSCTRGPR